MTQNLKPMERRVRTLCIICMGMIRFTTNKNHWKIDICDYCGQMARVKVEPQKQVFWKTWRGMAVIAGIATLGYVLFV